MNGKSVSLCGIFKPLKWVDLVYLSVSFTISISRSQGDYCGFLSASVDSVLEDHTHEWLRSNHFADKKNSIYRLYYTHIAEPSFCNFWTIVIIH